MQITHHPQNCTGAVSHSTFDTANVFTQRQPNANCPAREALHLCSLADLQPAMTLGNAHVRSTQLILLGFDAALLQHLQAPAALLLPAGLQCRCQQTLSQPCSAGLPAPVGHRHCRFPLPAPMRKLTDVQLCRESAPHGITGAQYGLLSHNQHLQAVQWAADVVAASTTTCGRRLNGSQQTMQSTADRRITYGGASSRDRHPASSQPQSAPLWIQQHSRHLSYVMHTDAPDRAGFSIIMLGLRLSMLCSTGYGLLNSSQLPARVVIPSTC